MRISSERSGAEMRATYVGEVEGREPTGAEKDVHERHRDGVDRVILDQTGKKGDTEEIQTGRRLTWQ